jgi:hypothetical protein
MASSQSETLCPATQTGWKATAGLVLSSFMIFQNNHSKDDYSHEHRHSF